MNAPSIIPTETLPSLIDRATAALATARSSAEVLEARDMARVAYDAAKSAGRMAKAKQAHDEVIGAVYRAQADALLIEARAKMRLADEYDAAQDRGEVHRHGGQLPRDVADTNIPTAADLGLRRDEIHDARKLRDAERENPGLAEQAVNNMLAAGVEPTRAELQRSILAAVADARKPMDRRNPERVNDPFRDVVLTFIDHCEQLAALGDRLDRIAAYNDPQFTTTTARLHRQADAAYAVLSTFMELRNA